MDAGADDAGLEDAGSDDAGGTTCATVSELQSIFGSHCSAAGCHGATSPSFGLDLVSPGLEARLVGVPSQLCAGRTLVIPGDPAASFLLEKLTTDAPECGLRMPVGSSLDPALVGCVQGWIRSLAPVDAGAPIDGGSDAGTDGGGAMLDAGIDAGSTLDAGSMRDAGSVLDAGAGVDSGTRDAGIDAGIDAGGIDAGMRDAGIDAGACSGLPSATLSGHVQPIFDRSCGGGACHVGAVRPAGNLDLTAGRSHGELVGVRSSACTSLRTLVVPGSPSTSYLVNKLTGVDMCSGVVMPAGAAALGATDLDRIRGWICAGAPND
jgi:hypothetical protein